MVSLVFVTGLLSNQSVFDYQKNQLKDLMECVVVELNDVDSPSAMAEKVLRLAPESFALAGHSIGGWVALRVMKMAPEKVTKLCLLNTSARGITPEEMILRQSVLARIQKGEFEQIAGEIADKFTFNPIVKKDVLTMFLQVGEKALVNQTHAMMKREDLLDVLPAIHCPSLVIHAAQDRRFSLEMHEELARNIPTAKLAVIDNCGHMSPMESPQVVATLMLDWLTGAE